MAALKLSKSTETEQRFRARALEDASKAAAEVPLETAELAVAVERLLDSLRTITAPSAASDLAVARLMVAAARQGAVENVQANLPSIHDSEWLTRIETKLRSIGS